ncbi:MAG: HNH endonuclease signature motif containing protein [Bacteroidota bacterium]|jgi:hypothetical protein
MPNSFAKPLPSLKRLDDLFEVRDGLLLNRVDRSRAHAGDEAGLVVHGYRVVTVDYSRFPVHRIVWAMTHRQDPGDLVIDHIDRNKLNNHPDNLRAVPHRLNRLNSAGYSHNTSGVTGVSWDAARTRWIASGKAQGKTVNLGRFQDREQAIQARLAWEQEQWSV